MGLLGNIMNKSASANNNQLVLTLLKRGKSPEQCKCIDYLYAPVDEAAKKGCGSKKPAKKKGCLGGNNAWDIQDYINHVDSLVNSLNLREKAIAKIGLDESQISEIPPVVLHSFIYRGEGIVIKSEETDIAGIWRNVSNK